MSGRLSSVVLFGLVVIATSMGCSVKEDRSGCPCVLMLDFSRVDTDRYDSAFLGLLSADGFLHRYVLDNGMYGEPYRVEVPKNGIWVNVCSVESGYDDLSGMLVPDWAGLHIPDGEECPPVNMFSAYVDTAAETVTVPVVLYKNYCVLSIEMVADVPADFIIAIEGNVCGYGKDGAPVPGNFRVVPGLDEKGCCSVRIPRQVDSSLRLVISDGDGVLREFSVGEYIIESGYDWGTDSLEDVDIKIDYAKADVTLVINDWEATFDINVEI